MLDTQRQEFYAEAKVLAQIAPHPNVLELVGLSVKPPIIVTCSHSVNFSAFLGGGTLQSVLQKSTPSLSLNIKTSILHGICAGMAHLHAQGLIHRDLAGMLYLSFPSNSQPGTFSLVVTIHQKLPTLA